MTTRFHFLQEGLIAQCVFDLFYGPGSTGLAGAKVAIWDNLKGACSTDLVLEKITLDGTGNELPVNESASSPTDALPPTVSALVAKVTATGRNGRFFWPGIPESSVNGNGRWTAGAQALFQGLLDDVMTDLAADDIVMRFERSDLSIATVDSLSLRTYIGTQRRRLHN